VTAPLARAFYARDALTVARALLGKQLRRGRVVLRITEVEAYRHPDDSASHCRLGKTPRNAPMWGPPGHAYVYLCYGIHQLLNLVCGAEGEGAAVLIRAAEPVSGLAQIRQRRAGRCDATALAGPGKVAAALGLDTSWSGHPLYRPGGLSVLPGPAPRVVLAGPRVGIDYARPEHRLAPWRLASSDTRCVTHARALRELAPEINSG
jgi:DNA-3-methyladenine glycosylase